MVGRQDSVEFSIGYGLWGCAGGLLLGLLGGGLLLIGLSLVTAIASPVPTPPMTRTTADLRLTVHESFLNRFIQTATGDQIQVDVLPGSQFSLRVDTTVSVFETAVPIQLVGLFEFRLQDRAIEIHLIDTKVSEVTLPPELVNFFDDALPEINQELNRVLDDVAAVLRIPLVFTDLGSDDTVFWLEAGEAPR
jgi:hypothetical protein